MTEDLNQRAKRTVDLATGAVTRRVWLCQCLCPQRHAILAASAEAEDEASAQASIERPLREQIAQFLAAGTINPWCGLCHAPVSDWTYQLRRTRFATMAEAIPALRAAEADQALTRLIWGEP